MFFFADRDPFIDRSESLLARFFSFILYSAYRRMSKSKVHSCREAQAKLKSSVKIFRSPFLPNFRDIAC